MLAFFEWLGSAYALYRISQDAGIWFFEPHLLLPTLENLRPVKDN